MADAKDRKPRDRSETQQRRDEARRAAGFLDLWERNVCTCAISGDIFACLGRADARQPVNGRRVDGR